MDRQLKVFAWNANGVATRRNELHLFASDHDADVLLIGETKLKPNVKFNVPGYQTYRTDRPNQQQAAGGTAVLVHRRITHRHVPTQSNNICESTGVIIQADGHEILIVAAYIAPQVAFQPVLLDPLLNFTGAVIIGGDLNAKHPSWNSTRTNARGRALRDHLDRRGDCIVVAPTDHTYFPPRISAPSDVIDVFLTKDLPFQLDTQAIKDLSSDHIPVLLTLATVPVCRNPPGATTVRTDWGLFNSLLQVRLSPPPPATTNADLDLQVVQLTATLTEALSDSSRPEQPRNTRRELPPEVRYEVNKRRRLRRAWQRTRNPDTRRAFNRQCQHVKQILDDYRTETWNSYLATLDIQDGTAWRTAKILRAEKPTSHPLQGQHGMAHSAADKARVFADNLEQQFSPHANIFDPAHLERIDHFTNEYFSADPDEVIEPFTLLEVEAVVSRTKKRKAPGLDGIGTRALQSAPPLLLECLISVFNSALRLHHFPESWKVAKVILIPKPRKSRLLPENYRPISLLPLLSKLFERLLLTRLFPLLDDFIRPEQFGFRRGHSTTHQLVRVVNKLVDAANNHLCTVAVFLDVSKAFDKVWHEGLLFKLSETPVPNSGVHLIKSYLTGRSFRTHVEGQYSTDRPVLAGVPQGSVLGPVLYLIYTNDIPTVPGATLSLYADDAMFQYSSVSQTRAAQMLQRQMNLLSPWLQKWRIAINTDKSNAIVFKKFRRNKRVPPPQITLDGAAIAWKPHAKYLGVTLDRGLNFGSHVRNKVAESRRIKGFISPLLNKRSPLPLRVKSTMFLLIVRSVIMYASTAWWALCSRTNRAVLEAQQSTALRMISGQPWFVRNNTIRASFQIPSLSEFARTSAELFFEKAEDSGLPHIEAIATRDGPPERFRPRPRALLDDPP